MTAIPSAEEITATWGERCKDHDAGCACCQMWAMHDRIVVLEGERGEPVAWRYRYADCGDQYWYYFTKEPRYKEDDEIWQPLYLRASDAAESRLAEAREEALEQAAVLAEEFGWTLPMFEDAAINEATDDAACAAQAQIAAAIRALKSGGARD